MFIKCVCCLPTQNKSTSEMKSECEPEVPPNRNSTESCDTGYNSSPSYHQRTDTGKLYFTRNIVSNPCLRQSRLL